MPPPNHGGSTEEEIRYRDLVEAHMIHNCNWSNVNGCKASSTCKCKRGYDDTVIQERTSFDERGFPEYKRDHECDLKVVPHIRLILLDWEGHANVEYAGSAFCTSIFTKAPKRSKYRYLRMKIIPTKTARTFDYIFEVGFCAQWMLCGGS